MWWYRPRSLLLLALLLDLLGLLLILVGIVLNPGCLSLPSAGQPELEGQGLWLIFCLLLYPLLGWLFGSYTVLRWRRLAFPVLLQRLLITTTVTFLVVLIASWSVNPGEEVWLVYWRVQVRQMGRRRVRKRRAPQQQPPPPPPSQRRARRRRKEP